MLFEVVYANGTRNEVELEGTSIIMGRDPSCDLVLNDVRCSRRHAVIEAGPDGLTVRDNGSANGVFVNGSKVERAPLGEGDTIRLGEVVINVLPDEILPTVAMDASDLDDVESTEPIERPDMAPPRAAAPPLPPSPPPAAPPAPLTPPRSLATSRPQPPSKPAPMRTATPAPPPPVRTTAPAARRAPTVSPAAGAPRPGTRAPAAARPAVKRPAPPPVVNSLPRPLTVTLLAGLWTLGGVSGAALGLGYALFSSATGAIKIAAAFASVLNAVIGVTIGWGLWTLASWARPTVLVLAGLGILSCVGTLPSLATLVYMLRPETKVLFSGVRDFRQLSEEQTQILNEAPDDLTFALVLLASLFVTFVLGAALTYLGITYLGSAATP